MIERLQAKRNEEGFTLIELLIVIIVLGILAAIVVFAVQGTKKDATAATCTTDVKSIELSAESALAKQSNGYTTLNAVVQGDLADESKGGLLKEWKTSWSDTKDYDLSWGDTDSVNAGIQAGVVITAPDDTISPADADSARDSITTAGCSALES